ncbi:MAG: hypothetical protein ACK41O_26440, partial [Runella zeae]
MITDAAAAAEMAGANDADRGESDESGDDDVERGDGDDDDDDDAVGARGGDVDGGGEEEIVSLDCGCESDFCCGSGCGDGRRWSGEVDVKTRMKMVVVGYCCGRVESEKDRLEAVGLTDKEKHSRRA